MTRRRGILWRPLRLQEVAFCCYCLSGEKPSGCSKSFSVVHHEHLSRMFWELLHEKSPKIWKTAMRVLTTVGDDNMPGMLPRIAQTKNSCRSSMVFTSILDILHSKSTFHDGQLLKKKPRFTITHSFELSANFCRCRLL
jgi:hypothetical protein